MGLLAKHAAQTRSEKRERPNMADATRSDASRKLRERPLLTDRTMPSSVVVDDLPNAEAVEAAVVACIGFDVAITTTSSGSGNESPLTVTVTNASVWPGAKTAVPDAAT